MTRVGLVGVACTSSDPHSELRSGQQGAGLPSGLPGTPPTFLKKPVLSLLQVEGKFHKAPGKAPCC